MTYIDTITPHVHFVDDRFIEAKVYTICGALISPYSPPRSGYWLGGTPGVGP